ncbi:MAG: ABC transporter permease [Chitinophagaceae bacterium]|nr:ABC transporter permease [Chitinophagaceae bacterium]
MMHHLKLSLRRLRRNSRSTIITVSGLALGIAAYILILEYVSFEKSVNGFHKNGANIYRLINEAPDGAMWGETEPGWVYYAEKLPEIQEYCRFADGIGQGIIRSTADNSQPFRETAVGYADGNFFSFFTFKILAGNPDELKKANTVFLSSASATKYFGKQDPVGKTLVLYNQFGQTTYSVAGIYEMPVNSDIQYNMVFSMETFKIPANLNGNDWAELTNLSSQFPNTCFLVKPGTDVKKLEAKLTDMRTKLKADKDGVVFHLQALSNVHLAPSLSDKMPTTGNLRYVYILGIVAILILVIAWFNYINLSTANAIKRAGEVGVRKVIGASRKNLVYQFLTESLLVFVVSLGAALLIVALVQPLFNELVKKELQLSTITYTNTWIAGFALMLGGSLLAAICTAYNLSGFNPVQTLKGKLTKSSKGVVLRKTLVVMQFSISIVLILVTVLIYQQLKFMQKSDLGLNPEQIVVVRGPELGKDSTLSIRNNTFLNELAKQSFVQDYAQTGTVPGNYYNFTTSGFSQPNSKKGEELEAYSFAIVDGRYFKTYGIKLKAGRSFTDKETAVQWNDNSKVMLNERAVAQFGFKSAEEALNTKVQWDERQLEVIGIVADYHHRGLQSAIDPIIFYPQNSGGFLSLRIESANMVQAVAKIESLYKTYFPGNPFDYFFEDENFNKQYQSEQQYGMIFSTASIWAILIACLGLFGLTTFSIEARTKEIGVRKVLGASIGSMVSLLSKDFLKLVLLASIIASPLAWWAISSWLQNFAYQVDIQWWLFVVVAIATGLIALVIIGLQTIKAAMANPVESLRAE